MDLSFYTAAVGANAQQGRLNIVSNNIANIQTEGYKSQSAGFVDLLYNKYYRAATRDPETGVGARVEKTDILYDQGGVMPTGGAYDYAINGEGFFAVYDSGADRIYYTRHGNFKLSNYGGDTFYLVNEQKHLVLDRNMDIILTDTDEERQELNIGVFDFISKEGMLLNGNNYYTPVEKNGGPILNESASEGLLQGRLEMSNVDLAYEMSRVIETQRAYQMSLKMIQTSDEVEQTINSLR